jgi:hypothetical protein
VDKASSLIEQNVDPFSDTAAALMISETFIGVMSLRAIEPTIGKMYFFILDS